MVPSALRPTSPPRDSRHSRILRRFAVGALLAGASAAAFLCFAETSVGRAAEGRTFSDPEQLPRRRAAVVLGCARHLPDGRENLYFRHRIAAAAKLYGSGRIDYLVVSGDNSRKNYDEPTAMREALVAAGVPAERIYRDYAGFRTLDSVVRAREIFGLEAPVFVSQRFHGERALYLARHHGLEALAFAASDPPRRLALKTRLREVAARAAAVLDVRILGRRPRFLGEPVSLGGPPT